MHKNTLGDKQNSDYMNSVDYEYTGLLVKLYLNLVQNGKINYKWVKHEIIKLQSGRSY